MVMLKGIVAIGLPALTGGFCLIWLCAGCDETKVTPSRSTGNASPATIAETSKGPPAPLPNSILYWARLPEREREAQFGAVLKRMNDEPRKRGRIPRYLAPAIYWLSRDEAKRRGAQVFFQSQRQLEERDNAMAAEQDAEDMSEYLRREQDRIADGDSGEPPEDPPSPSPRFHSNTLAEWRQVFRRQLKEEAKLLNPY